jgi:magnesium transporter
MNLWGVLIWLQCAQSNVQSTQEIVELILDSNRNSLLALDLKVRSRTLCIGLPADTLH